MSQSIRVAVVLHQGLRSLPEAERAPAAVLLSDLDALWALTLALSALAGLPVPELNGYDQLVRDQAGDLARAPGVPELLQVVRRAAAPAAETGLAVDTVQALRAVGPGQLAQLVQLPAFSALRGIAGPAPAALSAPAARPAAVPPLRDPSLRLDGQPPPASLVVEAYNQGVSDGQKQVRYIRAPYPPGRLAEAYARGYEVGSQQAAEPPPGQPPGYQPPIYQPPYVPPSVYTDSSAPPPLSPPGPPAPPPPPAKGSAQAGGPGGGLLLLGAAALVAVPAVIWLLARRRRKT
jgi:hypothetical protein